MADEMVQRAQRFVNSYNVSGIPKIEEDGKTSWTVMFALTRILQYHLGITALSDSFGPATLSALQSTYPAIDETNLIAGINRVIQSALYCKGYDGGEIDGVFNSRVASGVRSMKANMGVAGVYPGSAVTPKVFKALLTMDPYVTVGDGTEAIRSVQQWMNARYVHRRNFFIMPCDGNFSRDVQKALMFAIQYEIGMSDDVANGVFGPGTQHGIKSNVLTTGSAGPWVQLYTAALLFNRRPGATFTSLFSSNENLVTRAFQAFTKLTVNGKGDFPTWASLLVSYGDNTRRGTACDTATEITQARLESLRAAGYTVVGRYLCNVPGSTLNKKIQPGELLRCQVGGLSVFPIYQMAGNSVDKFSYDRGVADAFNAVDWARSHGFKAGTRIYFAVDFDALDYQVSDAIIPHFRGIDWVMSEHAPQYSVGIYGARNICSRVNDEGLATASFVSDMSSGYSGNLGYPLPESWAYDQISTITVGSGSGAVQIDNNIYSGRDPGQATFDAPYVPDNIDVDFDPDLTAALLADLRTYMGSLGYGETGSPDTISSTRKISTARAAELTLAYDSLITSLARTMRVRKSLIQTPLFWEIRHLSTLDDISDAAVIEHYAGTPLGSPVSDSSTGLAQIFARTAIEARNHCIAQGEIGGITRDPDDESELWAIWQRLHNENVYNISTVPLVLIHGAHQVGVARPNLTQSEADAQQTLARFNGTGEAAAAYGIKLLGLHRVFEKYNEPLRNR